MSDFGALAAGRRPENFGRFALRKQRFGEIECPNSDFFLAAGGGQKILRMSGSDLRESGSRKQGGSVKRGVS